MASGSFRVLVLWAPLSTFLFFDVRGLGYVRVGMELGWGGFDRAKLDMLILIRIPFSFHVL